MLAEHVGGMSPGCAATFGRAAGERVFVKAVGTELNAQTVELFRGEARLLAKLPRWDHMPTLLDVYEDGNWVALLMHHVDGRHPNMDDPRDACAVRAAVVDTAAHLTPVPRGVEAPHLVQTAERWLQRWQQVAGRPEDYLPSWAVLRFSELHARAARLPSKVLGTTLCHFDVRDDNLLIRPDGSAVLLDWGMARTGPRWVDLAVLAVQLPTHDGADLLTTAVGAEDQETVTDFLIAFAGSQAWNAQQPPPKNLPSMPTFCREDANRMLALARVRA